jgi:hypothetical protein
MNIIKTIKFSHDRVLHIILDDEEIIVTRLGNYENVLWYSWVSWGPNESTMPSYSSDMVTEEQIIERIKLLSNDEILEGELTFAIDNFFGRTVWKAN